MVKPINEERVISIQEALFWKEITCIEERHKDGKKYIKLVTQNTTVDIEGFQIIKARIHGSRNK